MLPLEITGVSKNAGVCEPKSHDANGVLAEPLPQIVPSRYR